MPNPVSKASNQRINKSNVPHNLSIRQNKVTSPHPIRPPSAPASARIKDPPPMAASKPKVRKEASSSAKSLPQPSDVLPRRRSANPLYPMARTIKYEPHPNHNEIKSTHGVNNAPSVYLPSARKVINATARSEER